MKQQWAINRFGTRPDRYYEKTFTGPEIREIFDAAKDDLKAFEETSPGKYPATGAPRSQPIISGPTAMRCLTSLPANSSYVTKPASLPHSSQAKRYTFSALSGPRPGVNAPEGLDRDEGYKLMDANTNGIHAGDFCRLHLIYNLDPKKIKTLNSVTGKAMLEQANRKRQVLRLTSLLTVQHILECLPTTPAVLVHTRAG